MGNPHLVLLWPDPADAGRGPHWAPSSKRTTPGGSTSSSSAPGPEPEAITLRVWERGVGETQACGTGSVAAAAAAQSWGLVEADVAVHNPGGTLRVSPADGGFRLSGPVSKVADVERGSPPGAGGPAVTPDDSAFTDSLISRSIRERIVLVGVTFPHATVADTEAGLDELALLVDTAGADVAGTGTATTGHP